MSLSWGRSPPTSQTPKPPRSRARLAALSLGAVVAAAAATVVTATQPRADADRRPEIQATFDALHLAVRGRDPDLVRRLYDPERPRLVECAIEELRAGGAAGASSSQPVVLRTTPYRDYVRADVNVGGESVRRYLRSVGGRWVISEPRRDELGPERVATGERIEVHHWGIDDQVAGALLEMAAYARGYALASAAVPKDVPLRMRVMPTRETAHPLPCWAIGAVDPAGEPFEIRIAGDRLTFEGTSATVGTASRRAAIHEALHWAQAWIAPGIVGRGPWWLIEGWPTLVAGGEATVSRQFERMRCDALPDHAALVRGPARDHDSPDDLVLRYYVHAASAVLYLQQAHGGEDAYWRLLREHQTASPEDALQRTLGVSTARFDEGWRAFVKERYCR